MTAPGPGGDERPSRSPVPAVDRAVAVVELCAREPGRWFTLSGLAREVGMSKATAHGLLAALCQNGWLVRSPDTKTYALGPGLVALADAVTAPRRDLVAAAQPELEALAAAHGVRATAATTVGDQILILAVAGQERPFGIHLRPGHRIPLVPPLGASYLAWGDRGYLHRWLHSAGPIDAGEAEALRRAVERLRRRSYAVTLASDAIRQAAQAAVDGGAAGASQFRGVPAADYLLPEIDPDTEYRVTMVAAPVRDATGALLMMLTAFDFAGQLTGRRIAELGDVLVAAAGRVGAALRRPPSPEQIGAPA